MFNWNKAAITHVAGSPIGKRIQSVSELSDWIAQTKKEPNVRELIPATFVIDVEGYLRVADRHSEHIACTGGQPVLSAGEIFFIYGEVRTTDALKTHFFCAIWAFTQLELMRAENLIENWYELQRNLSVQIARQFILEHLKHKMGLNAY